VITIGELSSVINDVWPEVGAEAWDSVGLVVGNRQDQISHVRMCVDVTPSVITDARDAGVDFLVAHHPLLLRGVTSLAEETYKGRCITDLIRSKIGLLTAHTNADVVADGVSDCLAQQLGLIDVSPIVAGVAIGTGVGRVGNLDEPIPLGVLARRVGNLMPATAQGIRVSGEFDQLVQRIALCGGAGDSLLGEPQVRNADVFITSDLRHHPASEFREWAKPEKGPALIDVSHWASEWVWLATAADQIAARIPALTVSVSDVRTDPWDFLVVQ